MKSKLNPLRPLATLFALTAAAPLPTKAAERPLSCVFANQQGRAQIEVLRVEGRTDLMLFKLRMQVRPVRRATLNATHGDGIAHLSGLLAAQVTERNSVHAAGLVTTEEGSPVIVNPQSIVLDGQFEANGSLRLSLYDESRVLQHGFGVVLNCR